MFYLGTDVHLFNIYIQHDIDWTNNEVLLFLFLCVVIIMFNNKNRSRIGTYLLISMECGQCQKQVPIMMINIVVKNC